MGGEEAGTFKHPSEELALWNEPTYLDLYQSLKLSAPGACPGLWGQGEGIKNTGFSKTFNFSCGQGGIFSTSVGLL